ncbi:MAG: PilZ domain-containing protein [Thermodesulfobacteriota bacterium]|nr:PilZ domain-containing protein [Thermodesulfobacteriota bacterium]
MTGYDEFPEVRLDDLDPAERRAEPRKPCFIPVTYKTSNRVYADYVKNISAGGVFIETSEPCMPGEDLTMMFSFPRLEVPIRTTGTVMWKSPEGVGVQFAGPCQALQRMVDSHWSVRLKAFF